MRFQRDLENASLSTSYPLLGDKNTLQGYLAHKKAKTYAGSSKKLKDRRGKAGLRTLLEVAIAASWGNYPKTGELGLRYCLRWAVGLLGPDVS